MPANGLRVNLYDFVALHSMWIIFLNVLNPLEKLSTSSEVPQNHKDLPSIRSQALPP